MDRIHPMQICLIYHLYENFYVQHIVTDEPMNLDNRLIQIAKVG